MKRKKVKQFTAFLVAAAMTASLLTGCGKGSDGADGDSAKGEDEIIKLNIVTNCGITSSQDDPNFPFEIFEKIKEETGVELTYTNYTDEALKVMLAGGDIGDIVCVSKDYVKPLIEGGHVVSLDDFVESGDKNITKHHPKRIEFSKKFLSNGTDQLYFLPASASAGGHTGDVWNGYFLRWDYYKELGCPEITDDDSYLKVLADMQKAHPETEDGKKTYGVGFFNDWTALWGWWYTQAFNKGFYNWGQGGYMYKADNGEIVNNYLDPDSPLWMSLEYGYKANQLGLLDPDSFTMKQADLAAKSQAGQYLGSSINWYVNSHYTKEAEKDRDTLKGYVAVPVEGSYVVSNNSTEVGETNKLMAITKNCEYPEKAMEVLDYLYGDEAGRLLYSGIEGEHWENVEGVPTLKQETIDASLINDDAWKKTGIKNGSLVNFFGLGQFDISEEDGEPMSLWNTEEVYTQNLTALAKDACDYYGASYTYEIYENEIKEGKMKDFSALMQDVPSALPDTDDDIKRIDSKLDDIITKAIPKVVLAEDKKAFESEKAKVIKELKEAKAETSQEWWFTEWEKAKAFVEGK